MISYPQPSHSKHRSFSIHQSTSSRISSPFACVFKYCLHIRKPTASRSKICVLPESVSYTTSIKVHTPNTRNGNDLPYHISCSVSWTQCCGLCFRWQISYGWINWYRFARVGSHSQIRVQGQFVDTWIWPQEGWIAAGLRTQFREAFGGTEPFERWSTTSTTGRLSLEEAVIE